MNTKRQNMYIQRIRIAINAVEEKEVSHVLHFRF
jgi:hypothetical protein